MLTKTLLFRHLQQFFRTAPPSLVIQSKLAILRYQTIAYTSPRLGSTGSSQNLTLENIFTTVVPLSWIFPLIVIFGDAVDVPNTVDSHGPEHRLLCQAIESISHTLDTPHTFPLAIQILVMRTSPHMTKGISPNFFDRDGICTAPNAPVSHAISPGSQEIGTRQDTITVEAISPIGLGSSAIAVITPPQWQAFTYPRRILTWWFTSI